MSSLNSLLSNISTEEGPRESYLPSPGQRLVTGVGDGFTEGGARYDPPAIGDEALARLELGAGVKDQRAARNLGQTPDLQAERHGCVIGVVGGGDNHGDRRLGIPAELGK